MEVHNVTEGAETFTSNAWLGVGERNVLVDAGSADDDRTVRRISERVDTLDAVVLTHQHGDHIGSLNTVLDRFDASLAAYANHPRRDESLEQGDEVRIGDEICNVVHTPGHADDHVSFVGEGVVFTGDVVVYNDDAFDDGSFGRTDMRGASREELIESVRRLLDSLPTSAESMYAGHGDAYTGDVHGVVERALERAERREPKY
ncbi:MAG: hydroxyacylglutathione hydrolase [Methanobacteriota archaeon]|jgi:hydroxyacylglutathione hydrolase|uniref:MBL fold metallo-hydrolase n=1 Tax=Halorutilus salinus TaxID=2487751 RepID=A0A9Q4GHS4_9EURY|nr:MBL fold metallo-hydrolase [Halorutilus salinus]MCX2818093.1 MBL fold metallo-hydrolase [Halorutilus salinus]